MRVSIDPALFERFPALKVGAFLATHLDRVKMPARTMCSMIAARHRMPIVGCDVDALPAPAVTIRSARPATDWFVPLGARPTDISSDPADVVYAAGDTVLCWSLDHRDSRQTCLIPTTRRAVFFSDATAPEQAAAAAEALQDLRRELSKRGAHIGAAAFADAHTPSVSVRFGHQERRH